MPTHLPLADFCKRLFFACALVLAMSISMAEADETGGAEAPDQDAASAAAAKIPWDTSCSQKTRPDEPDCQMSQMVIVPQSRQVLLRVEVRVPAGAASPNMVVQLPHGIYLPDGLKLDIDEKAWQEAEVQTCDNNGCYAGVEIDEPSLRRLEEGSKLTVSFQSLSREVVTVPVDLNGFSGAFAKIR